MERITCPSRIDLTQIGIVHNLNFDPEHEARNQREQHKEQLQSLKRYRKITRLIHPPHNDLTQREVVHSININTEQEAKNQQEELEKKIA